MAGISCQTYLNLLASGKHSDLTIDCQGVEFKVHRVLVCPQSPMIDAAISGPFEVCETGAHPARKKSSATNSSICIQEALTGKIKFPEEDPDILARIILFMYTNDYDDKALPDFYAHLYLDDEERESAENTNDAKNLREIDELGLRKCLNVNALVYKTAEMLGLSDLQMVASERFMRDAQVAFDMDGFEEPAQLIYENTRVDDHDLRFKVTQLCVENHDLLEIRPKTMAILQYHEPNVMHVTVELMKRWASDESTGNKVLVRFQRRLKRAVKDFNEMQALDLNCGHFVDTNAVRLRLDEDGSLTIVCPHCKAEMSSN